MKTMISIFLVVTFGSLVYGDECTQGTCVNGKGVFKYSNGNIYEGNFKNATLEGQGTFTYNDGEWKGGKYIGQFKNNKANGKGVFNYANGDKYDGGWEDNTLSGYGVFTSAADGKVIKGQWKNNKYVGP